MWTRCFGLATVALLCAPPSLMAFKGRVVHQGRPLANALVSVLGRTGEAITDDEAASSGGPTRLRHSRSW